MFIRGEFGVVDLGEGALVRARPHAFRPGRLANRVSAAITGMRVCRTHGGAAPQVREAARLRLTLLADPAVRRLEKVIKHGEGAQALAAIKVVLDRNELYAFGVEPPVRGASRPAVTVQTQVKLPEVRVALMSDQDLAAYDKVLLELRELLPAEEPKRLPGTVKR